VHEPVQFFIAARGALLVMRDHAINCCAWWRRVVRSLVHRRRRCGRAGRVVDLVADSIADAVVQVIIYGFISLVINSVVIYIHIYEHLVQFIYTLRAILLCERDRSRMVPLAHLPSTSCHRVSTLSPSLAPQPCPHVAPVTPLLPRHAASNHRVRPLPSNLFYVESDHHPR
jgi:hypothetical protein